MWEKSNNFQGRAVCQWFSPSPCRPALCSVRTGWGVAVINPHSAAAQHTLFCGSVCSEGMAGLHRTCSSHSPAAPLAGNWAWVKAEAASQGTLLKVHLLFVPYLFFLEVIFPFIIKDLLTNLFPTEKSPVEEKPVKWIHTQESANHSH